MAHAREDADTLHLCRGEAYQCTGGWLAPTVPREGLASDGTDHDAQALVARLRTTTYGEVPIRCPMGTASTTEH